MGDGREAVSKDPSGEKFPWSPPTAAEKAKIALDTLGAELIEKTSGKFIGLYFSAHWCPPCRGSTPKLAGMYKDGLKDKMEIIFVSSDKDEKSFNDYFNDMPWLALPYAKRAEKELLSDSFGVQGIPSFVVLNPDGWLPQPFNDVNDDPSPLNEEQCLIMLGSSSGSEEVVKAVAQEFYSAAGKDVDEMPIKFFSAPEGSVTEQLRKLTGLAQSKLIFLDIPSDGAFFVCDAEVSTLTEASVKEFIENVKAGRVERKQLQK